MDIEVSIIVPVYNVEKYLPNLFDSLKKQTFKNVVVKIYHIVQGVLAAILTVVIPRLAWLWGKKDAQNITVF